MRARSRIALIRAFGLLVVIAVLAGACTAQQAQQVETQEPAAPTTAPAPAEPTEPPAEPTEASPEPTEASAQPTEAPTQPEAEQAPLVIVQGVDPVNLDWHFATQLQEFNVMLAVFDTLGRWDEDLNPTPNLATEWRMIDDLTWEYKIREGVVAHNGEVIDANDVAYGFERGVDPAVGATGSVPFVLGNIKFDRAEVVDDYTVRIITKEPAPELPRHLVEWFVVPQDYYSSTPLEELARAPVGSGPYKFVEWRKGERLVLEANEDYWGEVPEVKQVIWRPVQEASARVAELNTGGADIVLQLPPDLQDTVDPAFGHVVPVPGMRRIYIGFVFYGPHQDVVQDKRVRQALNYAVDFQKIIDSVLRGNGERTGTFVNPPDQAPTVEPYPYDPERALELLAEAGFEDRDGDNFVDYPDGSRLELIMQAPNGRYVKDLDLAQAVAGDMQATGIYVDVMPMEFSVYAGQAANSELEGDLFFYGAGPSFSCQGDLADFYGGSGWIPGKWLDEGFDAMFDELIVETDPDRRVELCNELQEYMYEEVPLIFLYFQVDYYGLSNRIDWTPAPTERVYVRDIRWAE